MLNCLIVRNFAATFGNGSPPSTRGSILCWIFDDSRFPDFKLYDLAFKFLKSPFVFDQNNVQILWDLFNTKNCT